MLIRYASRLPLAALFRPRLGALVAVAFVPAALIVTAHAQTSVFVSATVPTGTSNFPLPDARAAALTITDITATAGQIFRINATGTVSGGPGLPFRDANGVPGSPVNGGEFPTISGPAANLYSLVGTFSDVSKATSGSASWFSIGTSGIITAPQAGKLILLYDDALYRANWLPAYADNVGGFNVNITARGQTQDFPILGKWDPSDPKQTTKDGLPIYLFNDFPSQRWFDPPMTGGYNFAMTDGNPFTSILDFPSGIGDADGLFTVSVGDKILGQFPAGMGVNFADFGFAGGVAAFTVSGIDPTVGSKNPTAFPIKLAFSSPTA